jgi:hypothetical protein
MMVHVYIIVGFVFLFLSLYIAYKKIQNESNAYFVKNYENYHIVLSLHMDKAFEIIYKEKIMAYSMEAMKINNSQYQAISKDFGYLVLKMIGPGLTKSFIGMYGSEETFLFNIMEYFNNKFENDEIYKSTTDDLMNGDTKDLFWGKINEEN